MSTVINKKQKRSGKKKQGILSAKDIMKGFTGYLGSHDIWTLAPIQTLPLEDKDEDWIKWNADWYENIALRELPKKAQRLQKLYNMAAGVLNKSDYIYNPGSNDLSKHLGIIGGENEQNLLEQFFPIAPNIMQVFMGKFLAMDKKIVIDAVDPDSINENLQFRENTMKQIFQEQFMLRKQTELIKQGLVPGDGNPETDIFAQEMQLAKQLSEAKVKFKKFRTTAAQWGQHFVDKYNEKLFFDEDQVKMFRDSMIADEVILALNMYEDDFLPEVLRPMNTYVNKSRQHKYYSKANFIVNIEFMTLPDVINSFRNKLTSDQIESLESQYNNLFSKDIMFESEVGRYSGPAYYNTTKSFNENMRFSVNATEHKSDKAIENFLLDLTNNSSFYEYSNFYDNPRLIRVSRIWWASLRKVGLLTKIEEGNPEPIIERIDENFLVTEEPEYDNSLLAEKSAKTLIKGEHIDWTDIIEWRYVIKIGENRPYYNLETSTEFENIYIDGQPIAFQFKGNKSLYEAKPPIEGCRFTDDNTMSVSPMERIRPWQILYNVLNNKATKVLPFDWGKILLMNQSTVKKNSLLGEDGLEPLLEYMDSLKETKLGLIDDSRETAADTNGRVLEPRVVDMSTVEQATLLMQLGMFCKDQAFQSIGISPQMAADVGKSESATGVSQAVQASANQIEPYFDQFSNKLMPRIWQMIIEAAQYYTTTSETFSDTYLTRDLEKVLINELNTDLLLRDLIVMPFSKANVKELVKQLQSIAMQDNTLQVRFIDRVKTLTSTTPSEIIEKLEEAEAQRLQEEQQKYEQEMMLQQQKQKDALAVQKLIEDREDQRLQAKLENDRYIAELKENNNPTDIGPEPMSETDSAKINQQQQALNSKQQFDNQKLNQENKIHQDNVDLKRREIEQKNNAANLQYMTAVENKQSADLKFVQLEKNKAKKAAAKK